MSLAYPKPDRSDHQPNDRKTAENDRLDRGQLQELLEREGLVRFVSEKRFAGGRLITDRSGNRMWEINIVVDDEDEFYAESGVSFARYPRT
jgi:hypothetical protein